MDAGLVRRGALDAVGFMWEGSYDQVRRGEIRDLLARLQQRVTEIARATECNHIVGITWAEWTERFRYFVGVPAVPGSETPPGMERVQIPAYEYASCEHTEGNAFESYRQLFRWIAQSGRTRDTSRFAHLEEYPIDMDPYGAPPLRLMAPLAE